ncbi:MAG: salicylate 1-monooxygenase [Pelagibacterales bacterium MED-G40]|nr:MAG: salicylate 1-monooxygenase [Pelagibacterales bacterium MED-G40]|tara:strand:- start:21254 stop:22384 length:1131 start_codon:yes stop_codon:yes gene_type:complete
MKKKLAIIGAGIAGLTFGNLIKKHSKHDFTIYEKEENLSVEEGYGIQLSTNSIKILNQIGFDKVNYEKIFHPKGVDFYNIHNKKICDLDLTEFNTEKYKYTTLQRSVLIEFLKDDIYTQHLRFGKRIKEVSELKGKVLIKFDDNTNDLVDIVVGADGIFSNTRSFFENKKNKPKFQKAIAVRTILKSKSELNISEERISLMMGKNCHLVIYPINKNKDLNLVCIIRDKKYEPNNIKFIVDKVVKQNQNLKKIFDSELTSWPLYSTTNILPSSNNKVFYIGDAFNGFLPTLAQGAGQSIESAYELFSLLKEENLDVQNSYFQQRLKRAKIVRKRSNLNFFVFHFSSSIMQIIRNFFMKFLVKRKSFINSYLGTIYKN